MAAQPSLFRTLSEAPKNGFLIQADEEMEEEDFDTEKAERVVPVDFEDIQVTEHSGKEEINLK